MRQIESRLTIDLARIPIGTAIPMRDYVRAQICEAARSLYDRALTTFLVTLAGGEHKIVMLMARLPPKGLDIDFVIYACCIPKDESPLPRLGWGLADHIEIIDPVWLD